jgi:hypothetical protein
LNVCAGWIEGTPSSFKFNVRARDVAGALLVAIAACGVASEVAY